jgi:arylsulfatase A-like enzyme
MVMPPQYPNNKDNHFLFIKDISIISFLTWSLIFWLILSLEGSFSFFINSTYWHQPILPFSYKLLLFFYSTLLWMLILFPFAILSTIINHLQNRLIRPPWNRFFSLLSKTFLVFLGTIFVLFYFGSWGIFVATNSFFGYDTFTYLFNQMDLLIKHLLDQEESYFLLSFSGSFLFVLLMVWVMPIISRIISLRIARIIVYGTLSFCLFGSIYVLINYKVSRHLTGNSLILVNESIQTKKSFYEVNRKQYTSPLVKIIEDFWAPDSERPFSDLSVNHSAPVLEPLVSISTYLKGFDHSQVKPYNVIVILVESLRSDRLTRLGSKRPVVPNIDGLAQKSLIFPNAYSQSSHSDYADLCPLSSLYPLRSASHHFYPEKIPYPRVLLYDILKPLGYKTAIFSSQDERWGSMYNFLNTGNLDVFFHAQNFSGERLTFEEDTVAYNYFKRQKTKAGKIEDRYTVAAAVRWIEKQNGTPFFIYMNLQRSHFPYKIPQDFPRRFEPSTIDFHVRFGFYPKEKTPILINAYDNSLSYVDFQLKSLFEYLEKKELLKNTIIVLSGDNGQAFYEHDVACHATKLYEEVIRVPLVLYAPKIKIGIHHQFVQHIDVPPTILSLLNLPPYPIFQGRNILKDDLSQRSIFITAQAGIIQQDATIRNGMKLVLDYTSQSSSLFDLTKDPHEQNNLMGKKTEIYEDLLTRILDFRKKQLAYYQNSKFYLYYNPPKFD